MPLFFGHMLLFNHVFVFFAQNTIRNCMHICASFFLCVSFWDLQNRSRACWTPQFGYTLAIVFFAQNTIRNCMHLRVSFLFVAHFGTFKIAAEHAGPRNLGTCFCSPVCLCFSHKTPLEIACTFVLLSFFVIHFGTLKIAAEHAGPRNLGTHWRSSFSHKTPLEIACTFVFLFLFVAHFGTFKIAAEHA